MQSKIVHVSGQGCCSERRLERESEYGNTKPASEPPYEKDSRASSPAKQAKPFLSLLHFLEGSIWEESQKQGFYSKVLTPIYSSISSSLLVFRLRHHNLHRKSPNSMPGGQDPCGHSAHQEPIPSQPTANPPNLSRKNTMQKRRHRITSSKKNACSVGFCFPGKRRRTADHISLIPLHWCEIIQLFHQ